MRPSDGLFNKMTNFSNFVGMPMVGFEKEIISLLRKMDTRRGHSVKASGEKRKPNTSSRFDKEIQKLECPANCNKSPKSVRGKGRSFGGQAIV